MDRGVGRAWGRIECPPRPHASSPIVLDPAGYGGGGAGVSRQERESARAPLPPGGTVGGLEPSYSLLQQMEGIINRIVDEVVGRLSVRGSWGSLAPPLTPAADPPTAMEFDSLPAPKAPMPGTLGAEKEEEKKEKQEGSGCTSRCPCPTCGWNTGEWAGSTMRGR